MHMMQINLYNYGNIKILFFMLTEKSTNNFFVLYIKHSFEILLACEFCTNLHICSLLTL